MKVIKRDGRIVTYDSSKIVTAIKKANAEVVGSDMVSDKQIDNIIKYIEQLNKKRMLVEDIQDIIEQKLMEYKKYNLAKTYIIYRYTRALVRKTNNNDETILDVINNNDSSFDNDHDSTFSKKRYRIASLVSSDLARRVLLPEKIVFLHDNKKICFNNIDFFVQPVINCSFVKLDSMINKDRLNINEVLNYSIINILKLLSNQIGSLTVDISFLGKYLKDTYDYYKNLKIENYEMVVDRILSESIYGFLYNFSYSDCFNKDLFIVMNNSSTKEYISENSKIISLFISLAKDFDVVPTYIYGIDSDNLIGSKYESLTIDAINLVLDKGNVRLFSLKKVNETYNNFSFMGDMFINKSSCFGKFNQGVVSIDLNEVFIDALKDYDDFYRILDDRLEVCFDALMRKYYLLLGNYSSVSKVHFQNGAIARLLDDERIDKLLKDGLSTLTLGVTSLSSFIANVSDDTFVSKVLLYLSSKCKEWKKNYNIGFVLECLDDDVLSDVNYFKYFNGGYIYNMDVNQLNNYDIINEIYENILYVKFK